MWLLCVFVLVVLLQRHHKVRRRYTIQRVVESFHPALLTRVLKSSTTQRAMETIQLVLLPLWVPLYVIVPAAQQLPHLTCRVSIRVERSISEQKFLGELKIFIWRFAVYVKEFQQCRVFYLLVENLMQILFLYFAVPQTIISTLSQSMSPSSTESTSFRPTVSSQSDNISVGLSLTPTPTLPLMTGTSAITKLFSEGGFFSSSFSSFVTQSASSLMSKSITFVT